MINSVVQAEKVKTNDILKPSGHFFLEKIAAGLRRYSECHTRVQIRQRNEILLVIKKIVGVTMFRYAWGILKKERLLRINSYNNQDKLCFYFIKRYAKRRRKRRRRRNRSPIRRHFTPRILLFLPNAYHCTCKIFRASIRRRRTTRICCHLLAIILAKAFQWEFGNPFFVHPNSYFQLLRQISSHRPMTMSLLFKCFRIPRYPIMKWRKRLRR